jgi:hypothetical protein
MYVKSQSELYLDDKNAGFSSPVSSARKVSSKVKRAQVAYPVPFCFQQGISIALRITAA